MLKQTKRQECLNNFSTFPLREYDKKKDQEIFHYPDIHSFYWLKLQVDTEIQLKKKLANELVSLYTELGVDKLTFLCDFKSTWITRNSKDRTDYKQLSDAIKYLRDKKVSLKFNGGITVGVLNLREFLEHFYILTRCDGLFSYYHFIDDNQDFIGYVNYDGEIRIDIVNKKADERFIRAIRKTNFEDTGREKANRI
ncbi:MAG: hypothetical protein EOO42_09960 [Flavobacteriales bacterium]|nr:MAG: hypothetical protein EOO42_09960 [Flavobacteriales bacterium]